MKGPNKKLGVINLNKLIIGFVVLIFLGFGVRKFFFVDDGAPTKNRT